MSRDVTFSQADVTRAVKAARAAGLVVTGVEIEPRSGRIRVLTGAPAPGGDSAAADELDELAAWRARRGHG